MTRDRRFYVREFLNLPHHNTGAHVLAEVKQDLDPDPNVRYHTVNLDIADCDRKISLELSIDPHARENTFHKLDLLIDTLQGLRRVMGELVAEDEWDRDHPRAGNSIP